MKNLNKFQLNPYHLVTPSPWPLFVSFSVMSIMLSLVLNSHGYMNNIPFIFFSTLVTVMCVGFWLKDIIIEGTYLGDHTLAVRKGLNLGFILFVISEVAFFLSIFWAYFHSSLLPSIELAAEWPPIGIHYIGPVGLSLFNTILLLSSGATLTWSHHSLLNGKNNSWNRFNALFALFLTILLALSFMYLQYCEYIMADYTMSDGIYGSVFYFGTGTHGLHIILGIFMLLVSFFRIYNYQFTSNHHLGFETSILYYHFVDVVWLFLYIIFYWWGT